MRSMSRDRLTGPSACSNCSPSRAGPASPRSPKSSGCTSPPPRGWSACWGTGGWSKQQGTRGKYALGFGIARLAATGTRRLIFTKLSQPVCEDLARRLGETVNVAVLHDRTAINISRGSGPPRSRPRTGSAADPLHATSSGQVLLAHLDAADREAVLDQPLRRYTPHTVTQPADLAAELNRVRMDGFAASSSSSKWACTRWR